MFTNKKSLSVFLLGLFSWLLLLSGNITDAFPLSSTDLLEESHSATFNPVPRHDKHATTTTKHATTTPTTEATTTKPTPPSLASIEAALTKAPAKDKSIFFTGLSRNKGKIDEVKTWAEKHDLTHVGAVWNTNDFTDQRKYTTTVVTLKAFQHNFSEVYAKATSGKAYLMMSFNKKPTSDSVFYSVEFAAMKASGKVTEIIWLDLDNKAKITNKMIASYNPSDPGDYMKTWWKQGDTDPTTQ